MSEAQLLDTGPLIDGNKLPGDVTRDVAGAMEGRPSPLW